MTDHFCEIQGDSQNYQKIIRKFMLINNDFESYFSNEITEHKFNDLYLKVILEQRQDELKYDNDYVLNILNIIKFLSILQATISCNNVLNFRNIRQLKNLLTIHPSHPLIIKIFYFLLSLAPEERILLNLHVTTCNINQFLQQYN